MFLLRQDRIVVVVLFAAALLAACDRPVSRFSESAVFEAKALGTEDRAVRFRLETVASGLEVPWGMAFLPDGRILVTERPGRVRLIADGKLRPDPVLRVPDVEPSGESGLMDIAVHPNFAANAFVFIAYAYRGDGKSVKIVRYRFEGDALIDPKPIIENLPAAQFHAGTRARFGPDGKLYVTVGDATDWNLAQKRDSLAGKILRLNEDGTIPDDNPFRNDPATRPEIFTLGHRNPQGIAWTNDGRMFETEHGPSNFEGRGGGADEFNLIEPGKNYGWPEIYGLQTRGGMETPLAEYTPACAPGSLMIYRGDRFPTWKGSAFFGCLRGTRLIRVKIDGTKIVAQEDLIEGVLGRIREVAESPDGFIYFSTSNRDGRGRPDEADDRIFRIVKE